MEWLREAAVLTAPDETYARERSRPRRGPARPAPRIPLESPAADETDGGYNRGRRRTGLRLTFHGGMPVSLWGRVAAGAAFVTILGLACGAGLLARRMVLRDERFLLTGSSSVTTEGQHHVSRAELLEVFGSDIGRNILRVSLDDRKAQLEEIPWVQHATVMRLLPDRIRVAVEERTPIAFVRDGGTIGLVDSTGVLLNMKTDQAPDKNLSFPIVTGISAREPASVRAARMKIFEEFLRQLDAKGEKVSGKLSEIDLSNPEDVKALIPDHEADVLVHFGDGDYLDRYKKYEAHLSEWRAQYPKLSSVDMRYERQVVLEMQPGTTIPVAALREPEKGQLEKAGTGLASKTRAPLQRGNKSAAKNRAVGAKAAGASHHLTKAGHP